MEPLITVDQARGYYPDGDTAHSFEHVLRVHALAERIAQAEGADWRIVSAAALLHDVSRVEADAQGACHAEWGARRARQILQGRPDESVEAVALAIASHRFRRPVAPPSLEAQVLYDADKLDAIGAVGVARAFAIAGLYRQKLWSDLVAEAARGADPGDIHDSDHTPVREFVVKLRLLKDTLYTATGRSIAEDRHRYMAEFFDRLGREVKGLA
jgi:uncharacterized protein